jgi:methyl-accepting chemotaxis protein
MKSTSIFFALSVALVGAGVAILTTLEGEVGLFTSLGLFTAGAVFAGVSSYKLQRNKQEASDKLLTATEKSSQLQCECITELAAAQKKFSGFIENLETAIENITQTEKLITESSRETADLADDMIAQLKALSKEVNDASRQTSQSIADMAEGVERKLAKSAEAAVNMTEDITAISAQTNDNTAALAKTISQEYKVLIQHSETMLEQMNALSENDYKALQKVLK